MRSIGYSIANFKKLSFIFAALRKGMDSENYKVDIPERFYSDTDGKPFEHCRICEKYLLDEGTSYVVEKALKSYEGYEFYSTLFEYAICTDCHTTLQQAMSKESIENLQHYYMKVMVNKGKNPIIIDLSDFKLDEWLSTCFFTGDKVSEMKEYQVVAQFDGSQMVMNTPPIIVGEAAMEAMSELLSDQTIDEMNGFKKQFFGPDPEFEEFIFGKKLILI